MCVSACVCVRVCVRACVRACVLAVVCWGLYVRMRSERVCAMSRCCAGLLVARQRRAVFIARPATPAFVGSRAFAAGAMWRCRTASAPWAGRQGHTTVVDAAGAIYVIGGVSYNGTDLTCFNDVWVSTDGGARPDSGMGWFGGTGWVL